MNIPSLRVWIIALLLLSLSVATGQPLATAAPAKPATLDQLVGAWAVDATAVQQDIQFPALITFTSDGIVLADEPPSPFETTGHGAWVATGPDSADYTFVALVGSESGALSAKIKVTGSLTMDAAADTWAGPFQIQVVDAGGAEIMADEGAFTGTRIAVETAAPVALQPGDKVGDLALAKGPDPYDPNVPPYAAFCNASPEIEAGSNVAKPGVYTVSCSMPPVPELLVGFGWVTDNQELLEEQWAAIQTELYVNGQPVDQTAFGQLDGSLPVSGIPGEDPNKVVEMPLRLWNVVLKDLPAGEFELRYVRRVNQELVDSMTTTPAGLYDITYQITVDPALAASEGEPASIEMVRSPVEYVGKIDTSAQKIQNPTGLAVDGQGNVYVTDGSDTPRVVKYDKDGNFVTEWGSRGSGEGEFEFIPANPEDGPTAGFVAVDTDGNVYVSDAYNGRVQKFDGNGQFLMQFGSIGSDEEQFDGGPGPIYVDSQGNIFVSTFPRVQKFDADGNFLAAYGSAGTGDGEFNGAALGVIDKEGAMYVADLLSARVQKLDADGKYLLQWGGAGTGPGQFFMPVGIVQDSNGKLYVSDNTDRVQVFTTDGEYQGEWSETSPGNPPLDGAIAGLAIDAQDKIYVADSSPSIYIFRPR